MANYRTDKELQKLMMEVLNEHHEDKVGPAKFLAAFRNPAAKSSKRVILGSAVKVSEMYKSLGKIDADFIILIAEDEWKASNEQKRKAIMDHQLSHCGVHADDKETGKFTLSIVPHDVGEFAGVFGRHGMECDEMVQMIEASGQMNLFKD